MNNNVNLFKFKNGVKRDLQYCFKKNSLLVGAET